jgi:hypothetical protein
LKTSADIVERPCGTRTLGTVKKAVSLVDSVVDWSIDSVNVDSVTDSSPSDGWVYVRTIVVSSIITTTETASDVTRSAFRVTVTVHVTPDLSKGRKQDENDHSPRNVELNSERPSAGMLHRRRLHSPAMPHPEVCRLPTAHRTNAHQKVRSWVTWIMFFLKKEKCPRKKRKV